jgi:ABC-type sugar transport system ATPase subunit
MSEYLLELRGIDKSFGGVHALQDVNLHLNHREILAIVGDNGAGKSTLMKVASGALIPDAGQIFLEGQEVVIRDPRHAAELGIQMVYQDLALVDCLDVATNLYLGREDCLRLGPIDIRNINKMREESRRHLKSLGIDLKNVKERVRNLSGGQRQVIAISRAVYWGTKLVIMDEPTAALGVRESGVVNDLIRSLVDKKNLSVIVISHNMQHVFRIADRVMVLRQGRNAGEKLIKNTCTDEVVKMITGAEFAETELR